MLCNLRLGHSPVAEIAPTIVEIRKSQVSARFFPAEFVATYGALLWLQLCQTSMSLVATPGNGDILVESIYHLHARPKFLEGGSMRGVAYLKLTG